ncbi:MAG: hypothetical protein ASARMPRED_000693 [Alectoria sarmentosa]|nr:MAG: hypothetical protein ASARMPRED_000693 [Alectoria sarmentosa]
MRHTLTPITQDALTDWRGIILPSQTVRHLFPSCIVRVIIKNPNDNSAEAIYFEITQIKDGTFWGIAQDTYRLSDWIGLKGGQQMTFRKENINEIPIDWQPKAFQKAVRGLVAQAKGRGKGYGVTGVRGVTAV